MLDETSDTESPFEEIMFWKCSHLTREREHADDTPAGKLTEWFVMSFVKRIVLRPGNAVIHDSVSTPLDRPLGGADEVAMTLSETAPKMARSG